MTDKIDGITLETSGNTWVLKIGEDALGNEDAMDKVQDFMNTWAEAIIVEEKEIAEQFNVSFATAAAIQYLRTRSRWTQEKENELVERDHQKNPINPSAVFCGDF